MPCKQHLPCLRRDTRGAVMAEAVIIAPLFVFLFACTFFFYQLYGSKLERSVKARSCAWHYSINGCDDKFLADGCNIDTVTNSGKATVDTSAIKDSSGNFGEGLEVANKIALSLTGLSQGIVAKPSRDVTRPSIMGGGTFSVAGSYSVMCNEKKRTVPELVKSAYCEIAKSYDLPKCPS